MQRPPRLLAMLLLSFVGLTLLSGCLYIPQRHRQLALQGEIVPTAKLGMLVPGETTKAEFIEKVGQPYLMMDDYGVMVYYWKMLTAYVPWAFGMGYGGSAGIMELSETSILLLAYDANGIITRHAIIQPKVVQTVNEAAITWVGQGAHLTSFRPLTPPAGQAVVYILHLGAPGVSAPSQSTAAPAPKATVRELRGGSPDLRIAGVFLNGKLWAEIDWGQYAVMLLPPGTHEIGVELSIRKTDKFMRLQRQTPAPAYTTSLDTQTGQSYVLEIFYREVGTQDIPHLFRQTLEEARPKLAGLKRVR